MISCPNLSRILGQFLKYCKELLQSVRTQTSPGSAFKARFNASLIATSSRPKTELCVIGVSKTKSMFYCTCSHKNTTALSSRVRSVSISVENESPGGNTIYDLKGKLAQAIAYSTRNLSNGKFLYCNIIVWSFCKRFNY
ncbi:hypothetical protein NPIL_95641 [Nephila pilipes]|uniref:Uncharacterized protein n=1 Tax=Nephila pilipes TaxID=299642 RepID=A0A8X6UAS1_NEPPI|nr:hypothetical protein NPIL_95641 [Nephila pilipes]